MATAPNVVALNASRPLGKGTVEPGSRYKLRRGHLALHDRRTLKRIEDELLSGCQYAGMGEIGTLNRREFFFQCDAGCISFFFSWRDQKYILTDFEIFRCDTGGLPSAPRTPCPPSGPVRIYHDRHNFKSRLVAVKGRYNVRPLRQLIGRLITSLWQIAPRHERDLSLTIDALAVSSVLSGHHIDRTVLPNWSLLKSSTRACEELGNRYSRAILAGELLGRLSCEIGAPEIKVIIPRVGNGDQLTLRGIDAADGEHAWRLLVAEWIKAAPDGDTSNRCQERIAAQVSLSMMLSRHVWSAAETLRNRIGREGGDPSLLQPMFRKFAMVSEFVWLSHRMTERMTTAPGACYSTLDYDAAFIAACDVRDAFTADYCHAFGRSVKLVIYSLNSDLAEHGDAVDDKDMETRLASLGREIMMPIAR